MKIKRILLKLSGEAFQGRKEFGIDERALAQLADQIELVLKKEKGIELAIVVGGGNIFRGVDARINRVTADKMGMLATVINGLALQDELERRGIKTEIQSAILIYPLEMLDQRRALMHLESGYVVIFTGGTGNPFVTTDTAAALRASEIGADLLLKATNVDGIYTDDPKRELNAKRLERISYEEIIAKGLKIMDLAAIAICRENKIPIIVFDIFKEGNLERILAGEEVGTLVTS